MGVCSITPRVCVCDLCVCQLKIINKRPLTGGEDFMSINILMEIIQNGGKHGRMVCFMRQEKEGIVRERERASTVYGEHSQQHRLTGNVVFFLPVGLYHLYWSDGVGGWGMCGTPCLKSFFKIKYLLLCQPVSSGLFS